MRTPALLLLALGYCTTAWALDLRGELGLDVRQFPHQGAQGQSQLNVALRGQADLWYSPNQGRDAFTFSPFVRADTEDSQRDLVDIRELAWLHVNEHFELRTGIRQVYWGVTEGARLVDIINQTDTADGPEGDRKLGQPMVNLSLGGHSHTLDLFLLLGHRQPTFPGTDGRMRLPLVVDTDQATWESSRKQERIDLAARWQWTAFPFWLGISGFSGTAREPELAPVLDPAQLQYDNGQPVGLAPGYTPTLAPHYPLIHQLGLDLQVTQGDLLWKLEAIQRWGGNKDYHAANAGLEYTQVGVLGSRLDLGWLLEGLYDSRGREATTPFDRDLLLGWRLTFNDMASTELLSSVIVDLDSGERLFSLEARRRLADGWSIALELRQIAGTPGPQTAEAFVFTPDTRYALRPLARDSFTRLQLSWFF